jgi:hypothetical protein
MTWGRMEGKGRCKVPTSMLRLLRPFGEIWWGRDTSRLLSRGVIWTCICIAAGESTRCRAGPEASTASPLSLATSGKSDSVKNSVGARDRAACDAPGGTCAQAPRLLRVVLFGSHSPLFTLWRFGANRDKDDERGAGPPKQAHSTTTVVQSRSGVATRSWSHSHLSITRALRLQP